MVAGRNSKLALFPKALYSCSNEAAKYAACISYKDDVKKNDCNPDFIKLRNCFQRAMKDLIAKKG